MKEDEKEEGANKRATHEGEKKKKTGTGQKAERRRRPVFSKMLQ